jgi:hypothetical protein
MRINTMTQRYQRITDIIRGPHPGRPRAETRKHLKTQIIRVCRNKAKGSTKQTRTNQASMVVEAADALHFPKASQPRRHRAMSHRPDY